MNARLRVCCIVLGLAWLATLATGCGPQGSDAKQGAEAANQSAPQVVPVDQPKPDFAVTDVNLAANDLGGGIEELTGVYGPGFLGRRLVDGLPEPTWKIGPAASLPAASLPAVTYPQEAVFSFYERHPALVGAVAIALPADASLAPLEVEVWTSMESPTEGFTRAAAAQMATQPGEQVFLFPPVEARFVKLRVLSGASPDGLEIAELRVLEAARDGYVPLAARAPGVRHWKGSPREAAQRGLEWLQQAGGVWIQQNGCFGCHVQAQVLMGQRVAHDQGYRVNEGSMRALFNHLKGQATWGSWWHPSYSATAFGAMGTTHAMAVLGVEGDRDYPYTDKGFHGEMTSRLLASQLEDGSFPVDEVNPPIVQGRFMTTGNYLVAIEWAADRMDDTKLDAVAERALAWIASNEPETTQDKIFKIIALMHYGTPDQKRSAWSVVETLATEQQPDGGWKENAASAGSNAIATGQVLYAFKQAGISIHGEMFRHGVDFLLGHEVNDPESLDNGSWAAMNTASETPSGYAHTMWAVIGLAGAYGTDPTGALQIVRQHGDRPPARTLEIILDVSGSMNARLESGTRWTIALAVLEEVVAALPEDLHVGLRVYGHRHASKSKETCSDIELVVPLEKLDRERIVAAAAQLRPRGETPLVRSVLLAAEDLRAAGGGAVILITDGEESCKGDLQAAADELRTFGLPLTLNIVGFTVTGQTTAAELGTLAASTGGHYYGAQDGSQLSRAVLLAALQRLPYDVLDAEGQVLASGQTSGLSRELPPGSYRLRIEALGQVLEEPLTIVPDQTTTLGLAVEGDQFVIRR